MVRHIDARIVLEGIAFDMQRMLKDGTRPKLIYVSVKRRIERMKDTQYQKMDW